MRGLVEKKQKKLVLMMAACLPTYTLCKVSDAQHIPGTEAELEELGACVAHPVQLEKGGAQHQVLHVVRRDDHLARVGKVDQALHS